MRFVLPSFWEEIGRIRHSVDSLLCDQDDNLRNGAAVAISELAENAVKYGIAVPSLPEATIDVKIVANKLVISVANGIAETTSLERLKKHLELLETGDPMEVYLKRLKSLSNELGSYTGLGIFRIAVEGRFKIRMKQQKDTIVIIAERLISGE